MSGFLDEMARSSAQRVSAGRDARIARCTGASRQASAAGAALLLSARGFDVIAELKLRSPAAGRLGAPNEDWLKRVTAYAQGGAAAVSVLTEPSRFDGSLEHLRRPRGAGALQSTRHAQGFPGRSLPGAGGARRRRGRRAADRANAVAGADCRSCSMRRPSIGLFVLLEAFDA